MIGMIKKAGLAFAGFLLSRVVYELIGGDALIESWAASIRGGAT